MEKHPDEMTPEEYKQWQKSRWGDSKKKKENDKNKTNKNKPKDPNFKNIRQNIFNFRRSLPIWGCKRQIIEIVSQNQTTILIGETGCGKSTQVPQFLVDSEELNGCSIAVTQPRRVSAISLADRVAFERNCKTGSYVGYSVRFDTKASPKTNIKFVTDGMLLREILADPMLTNYNVVILDEIHERTVQTDLLIGLLRDIQSKRDLKLVLMSATLSCQLFVDFFGEPPIIHVRGRTYPVSIFYTEEPMKDYQEATVNTILQLNEDLYEGECAEFEELQNKQKNKKQHNKKANKGRSDDEDDEDTEWVPTKPMGDFLVFLTGQDEIEQVKETLMKQQTVPELAVLPLYAALPLTEQQNIFKDYPDKRKVILSTNIAETSLTISGIKYVIDCGLVKMKSFNPVTGIEVLGVTPVAKAQAVQRSGRAGRQCPGQCYRLYTEETFFELKDSPVAEIRRADLASVVLQLFALGIKNPMTFGFLERPPTKMIQSSIEQLWALGALDEKGDLSEDGKKMALFPLTPRMTKILLLASQSGCASSAITLLAMMCCENLFSTGGGTKKGGASSRYSAFVDQTGDHISLIRIYEAYIAVPDSKKADWCWDHFVQHRALQYAVNVRQQLEDTAKELNVSLEEDPENERRLELLRQCIAISTPENIATLTVDRKYKCILDGTEIYVHPSSFAMNKNLKCIVFSERSMTQKLYARWVSEASPDWVNYTEPQ